MAAFHNRGPERRCLLPQTSLRRTSRSHPPDATALLGGSQRGTTLRLALVTGFLAPYDDNGRNPEVHTGYSKGRNDTISLF